eukprot:TRINITY_DN54765_c0_g1_i1.p1 TRINITY_DN54765_c0_g1~~TRINITY_DN54765_c0_g1_i1.p1  ORF type:complete len:615 (-),score=78.90 TRINITY_DN54765_c0_g1_i1:1057-2901(-)
MLHPLNLDRTYLQHWNADDALRELYVNAWDANGNKKPRMELSPTGNELTITNDGTLELSDFIYSASAKDTSRYQSGKFGAGLKDALAPLMRSEVTVKFITNEHIFTIVEQAAEMVGKVMLHVLVENVPEPSANAKRQTCVQLTGTDQKIAAMWEDFNRRLVLPKAWKPAYTGEQGELYNQPGGKIYLDYIKISEDKRLRFSYNFYAVHPDIRYNLMNRDRKNVTDEVYSIALGNLIFEAYCESEKVRKWFDTSGRKRKKELNYSKDLQNDRIDPWLVQAPSTIPEPIPTLQQPSSNTPVVVKPPTPQQDQVRPTAPTTTTTTTTTKTVIQTVAPPKPAMHVKPRQVEFFLPGNAQGLQSKCDEIMGGPSDNPSASCIKREVEEQLLRNLSSDEFEVQVPASNINHRDTKSDLALVVVFKTDHPEELRFAFLLAVAQTISGPGTQLPQCVTFTHNATGYEVDLIPAVPGDPICNSIQQDAHPNLMLLRQVTQLVQHWVEKNEIQLEGSAVEQLTLFVIPRQKNLVKWTLDVAVAKVFELMANLIPNTKVIGWLQTIEVNNQGMAGGCTLEIVSPEEGVGNLADWFTMDDLRKLKALAHSQLTRFQLAMPLCYYKY